MNRDRKKGRARGRNRQGKITGEAVQWLLRLFTVFLLASLLLVQINLILGVAQKPVHLELSLYRERLLNAIWMRDALGTPQPGFLDLSRFDGKTLAEVYVAKVPVMGARLSLYENASDVGNRSRAVRVVTHQPDVVARSLELAAAGLTGSGGGWYESELLPVLLRTKKGLRLLLLEIEVVEQS